MSLEEAFAKVDKQFGKGAVMRLGDTPAAPIETISTGSLALDAALGTGGLPRGRIVELYGPESSGKSTLALQLTANAQKLGSVLYVDTEHALDPGYAAALGVNISDLLMAQPDNAEQAFEIIETMMDSGELSLVVLDSVAAMASRRELEGDYGDSNVGLMARLMSQAMRKLVARTSESKTLLLCINQLRMKVGVVYGSPEVTTGGLALKYYSSVRMDIRRIETEKQGTDAVGNRTRVKVVKNKLAPPLKIAEFSIEFGKGISRLAELVDLGVQHKIITKSGSWLSYDEHRSQGRSSMMEFLEDSPGLADEIEAKIREALQDGEERPGVEG